MAKASKMEHLALEGAENEYDSKKGGLGTALAIVAAVNVILVVTTLTTCLVMTGIQTVLRLTPAVGLT